jgi:SH3-like domain-containing protein
VRLDPIKSPDERTDSAFSEQISLIVCPFLGMDEDPGTSFGFAHGANHCHGLGKPVGIELAHQNRYCLGENHSHCYVYAQSIAQSKPDKMVETGSNPLSQSPENAELNSNEWITNRRGLRVIGLLIMLLLIGIAAVIWWPPPGTSWQDFVAYGSSDTNDVTHVGGASLMSDSPGASEQAPFERPAASAVEAAGLGENPAEGESNDQAVAAVDKSNQAIDKQEKTTGAQLVQTDKDAAPLEEKKAVTADETELDNLLADSEMVISETTLAEEEPVIEAPAEADIEESAAPAPKRQTADLEQTEHAVTEEVGAQQPQEADVISAVETGSTNATSAQSEAPDLEAAVMTTFIGPISNAVGLQGNSNSSPLLFLLSDPRDGAEVLAMIPERQSVTVLGRDSSGEWLMVRLSSGVEGWVRARESGAPIVVSNLPMADEEAGNGPVVQNPVSASAPAEVTQSPTLEDGSPVFGTAVINSGALNLRSGPDLEYEPVGVAYNGQQVFLLEPPGSRVWVLVRLADGKQGWMNSNYLIQIRWAE